MQHPQYRYIGYDATKQLPVHSASIIPENELPKNHRILCFLPHADDVRFIGCSLKSLNQENDLTLVIAASGHHAILQDISMDSKKHIRMNEMMAWCETMDIPKDRLHFLEAEHTYEQKIVLQEDQHKVTDLITRERPSMIMMPQRDDVLQPINRCVQKMVIQGIKEWIMDQNDNPELFAPVLMLEYPTLYNPLISFKYRNLNVLVTESGLSEQKHLANKAFRSLDRTSIDLSERCVEAYDASCLSEYVSQYRNDCTIHVSARFLNARNCRCEHFHASLLRTGEFNNMHLIYNRSLKFPLSGEEEKAYLNSRTPS